MDQPHDHAADSQTTPKGGVVYEGPHVHHEHLHVTPALPMTVVFIVLIILTVFTVIMARVPMSGAAHLITALVIACVKGALVMAYFMHLRYDKGMPLVVTYSTFFGVVLFLGLTLADISSRPVVDRLQAGEIHPGGSLAIYGGDAPLPYEGQKGAEMNIVDFAIQSSAAEESNPDADAGDGDAAAADEPH